MYQQRFQHHNRKPQPYAQERDSTIVCARAREYPLPWRSLQSARESAIRDHKTRYTCSQHIFYFPSITPIACLFEKELLDRTQLDALLEEALDRCNAVGHSGQQNNPEQDLWIRWKKELMDGVRRTPELGALFLDCLTEMASSHSKSLFLHTRDILRMCHDHCLARVTWEKALRDRTSRPFRVEFTMPELRPLVEWYGLVSHQEHARNPLAFRDLPVMTMTDLVWLLADYFKLGFFASYSLQQAPAKVLILIPLSSATRITM